jgi:hypothetical protein
MFFVHFGLFPFHEHNRVVHCYPLIFGISLLDAAEMLCAASIFGMFANFYVIAPRTSYLSLREFGTQTLVLY